METVPTFPWKSCPPSGGIRAHDGLEYAAEAVIDALIHCHCETCRKAHGAAFSSLSAVPRERFRWTKGEAMVKAFESSPGKRRWFCSECGSHIVAERRESGHIMLRLGCLDTPITVERQFHIWRSDAASWFDPGVVWPVFDVDAEMAAGAEGLADFEAGRGVSDEAMKV